MLKLLTALITFSILAIAQPARGALLNGTITGVVTSAGTAVPGVTVGSAVTGSYTFDTSTSFNGLLGVTNPLTAFSLAIGTNPYVFSMNDLALAMPTRAGVIASHSTSTANELFFFFTNTAVQNFVGGYGTQTISNAPPEIFIVNVDTGHSFTFDFVASSNAIASAANVPEPSSAALIALGCVALLSRARRRR